MCRATLTAAKNDSEPILSFWKRLDVHLKIGSFFFILEKFTFPRTYRVFLWRQSRFTPPIPFLQSNLTGAAAVRGQLGPRGPHWRWDEGKCVEAGVKNSFQLQPGPNSGPPSSGCVSLSGPDGPTRSVKRPSDSSVKSVTRGHLFWTQQLPAPFPT